MWFQNRSDTNRPVENMHKNFLSCLWPRSNTANLGPVTGPIRNNLINNIIIFLHAHVQYVCIVLAKYQMAPAKTVVGVDRPV